MSLSKACVIHKKIQSKTKKSMSKVTQANKVNGIDLESRLTLFQITWRHLKEKARNIQSNSFMEVLTDLTTYLNDVSKQYIADRHVTEIPTAIFNTGVNIPDHEVVYEALGKLICENVSNTVVFVSSHEAATFKTLMQKIVGTLVKIIDEDENEELAADRCTLQVLRAWYNSINIEASPSPSKRFKRTVNDENFRKEKNKPIIIVFKDFESFQTKAIEDFIQISRCYVDHLPIMLVFCVSTFGAAISEALSQTTLSSLSIKMFSSENPLKQLGMVLEEIMLSHHSYFRLGSRVYKCLTDYFLFSDYSVKTFLSGYKLSMLSHFYLNPYSSLCCDVNHAVDHLNSMDRRDIEKLRELCFSNSIATAALEKNELKRLLQNDEYFKKHAIKLLNNLNLYHRHFFIVLRFFHAIAKNLPKLSFGNKLHQIYELCIDKEIRDSEEFKDFIKLIKLMAREELVDRLTDGVNVLKQEEFDKKEIMDFFKLHLKELKDIAKMNPLNAIAQQPHSYEPGKKLALSTLQKSLKEMREIKKQESPFERLRSSIANYLEEFIGQGLRNYKSFAFHEIYYFDNIKYFKQNFIGEFDISLKFALGDPRSYIKCKCCNSEDDAEILPSYPDISIAYKLLLESGHLINLFDWMQSFVAVIDFKNSDNLSSNKRSKRTKQLIARFTQSVGELQYLGLIKKTSRKTDHVARLFW